MSSLISGNTTFPVQFTIPSDGDPRNASSVNVAFQALADRTTSLRADTDALHTASDQARYLNWPWGQTFPNIVGDSAALDYSNGYLLVAGSTGASTCFGYILTDFGAAGQVPAEMFSGITASGEGAIQAAHFGNTFVLHTGTRYVYVVNAALRTAAKVDVGGAALAGRGSGIVYDPIRGAYVYVQGQASGAGPLVRYASNPSGPWTTGGSLNSITTTNDVNTLKLAVRPDTGLVMVMAVQRLNQPQIRTAVSTDRGVTWTMRTFFQEVNLVGNLCVGDLTFDALTSSWFMNVTNANGANIWRSTNDGVSWTRVLASPNYGLGQLAIDEFGAIVAQRHGPVNTSDLAIAASLDQGATMKSTGIVANTDILYSPAIFTGTNFVIGQRYGSSSSSGLTVIASMRTGKVL